MKTNIYKLNGTSLTKTDDIVEITKDKWVRLLKERDLPHVLTYNKVRTQDNKTVYFLYSFVGGNSGEHIALSFWENQKFLFLVNEHWLQKSESLKFLIPTAISFAALMVSLIFHK